MGENSKIEWTDHTASPWHGCEKVAVGCDNCYAAQLSLRNPGTLGIWGPDGVRVKSKSFTKNLRLWNSQAEKSGKQVTVFPSLCDPFEDRPELVEWRNEMFSVIDECPWVTLLLLTKRPENVRRMWPACPDCGYTLQDAAEQMDHHLCASRGGQGWHRKNVWIGTSIATQADADRNIPHLLKCRDLSPVLFVSAEPLLGPVDLMSMPCEPAAWNMSHGFVDPLRGWYSARAGKCGTGCSGPAIDLLIAGGESGPNARPMHPDWARSLRDQCQAAGVPFFMKQMGGVRKPFDAIPDDLMVREFPQPHAPA
jgi:protein gp37